MTTTTAKVGLVLPSFRLDADTALDTARRAEEAGLDGVFVYDHLFPMGQPERPALSCFPLLAAVAVATSRVTIGPLVARVRVVPDAILVGMFETLARLAPGRVIAAVGTGDSKSQKENEVFGIPFAPVAERVEAVAEVCRRLRASGLPTWVGGGSAAVRRVAAEEADALDLWAVPPAAVAEAVATGGVAVTWAGPPPSPAEDMAEHVAALASAGAEWVVYGPPPSVDWPGMVDRIGAARP